MRPDVAELIQTLQQIYQALQPSGWTLFAAAATVVSAIATAAGAIATAIMVKEMKDTREETFRPYVIIDYEGSNRSIFLLLKNAGQTVAENVKVEFDSTLKNALNEDIGETVFNVEIPTIIPGWEYRTYINEAVHITPENGYTPKLKTTVRYNSRNGKQYVDYYILNIELYRKRRWLKSTDKEDPDISLKKISDSLETISKDMNEFRRKIGKM